MFLEIQGPWSDGGEGADRMGSRSLFELGENRLGNAEEGLDDGDECMDEEDVGGLIKRLHDAVGEQKA